MTDLEALLAGIVAEPLEETRWLVLADWLEENDDPRRAEFLRLHRRMLATCCEPDTHPERAQLQSRMTELLIAGVKPCVPQETLMLPGGVPMTFSFIPPGSFLMGSEKGEDYSEKPVHLVEHRRSYFFGITPVTQMQWAAVMGSHPSHFKGGTRPVEMASWDDCQQFCTMLSELAGCRIELPTEAEWEYACRAGTTTEYHCGNVISTELAHYDGSFTWNGSPISYFREETIDVGSFAPNSWYLFDMHGNIREWCSEWLAPYSRDDLERFTSVGIHELRAVRGGCWLATPESCRSAARDGELPSSRTNLVGFRVCLRLS